MYCETLYFFTNILATSSRVYMNAGIQYSMQRVINTSTLLVNYWGATAVVVRNCDLFRVLWWSLDWQQQKFHVLHDFLLHCQWWISCYLLLALLFRYIYINDIGILVADNTLNLLSFWRLFTMLNNDNVSSCHFAVHSTTTGW